MRRTAFWPVLALTLIVLSGNGTAVAEEPSPKAIHTPMPVPEMPPPPGWTPLPEPAAALAPVGPEVPVPFAPPMTTGFLALPDNNFSIPPDTHGAVGPTKVMTVLNTQVNVQLHDGTQVGGYPIPLNTFWDGVRTPSKGTFDPRVKFDPDPAYGGRWIWVSVQDARGPDSGTLVAVSADPEPNRGPGILLKADPNTGAEVYWADYPTVGFNKSWVVVQVNMFDIVGPAFNRTKIYVFDKAKLYAGVPITCAPAPTLTGCTLIESTTIGGTQVPAATYDFALAEIYLLQKWNSTVGVLQLWRIDGPIGNETLTQLGQPAAPPWSNKVAGDLDFAPQSQAGPGCDPDPGPPIYLSCATPPCKIQTNDSRVQNVVYRGGTLWTAQTVFYPAGGTPARSSIQWWQIGTDSSVVQRGLIDDALSGERFYAFPSIAVNRHMDVLLGYSTFHDTDWVGARYSFRYGTDPLGVMQTEQPLKAGEDCYFKDLGTGRNRWGDYSHTVVDPTDDTKLWTIQEYAATSDSGFPIASLRDKWGTWWGMMDPTRAIVIDDVSMNEGDAGTTAFVFTLNLMDAALTEPAPSPLTITVEWDTADGTALVADGDYVAVSGGLVTFAPGETTKTLTVDVNGDIKWEIDEDFFVDLTNPTNAILGDNRGKGTITNDDPLPQISIGDVQRLEGNGGADATDFAFTVSLSNPSSATVSANWTTVNGTAIAGLINIGDYTANAGLVSFPPGILTQTVTVKVHGDLLVEPDEIFYVDLSGPTGGTLLRTRGVGTIFDDDAPFPPVGAFAVVSDGDAIDGRNRLEWSTPAGATGAVQYVVRYNEGASCTPPMATGGGSGGFMVSPVVPGGTHVWPHPTLILGREYCYSIWIDYGGNFSSRKSMSARPFDASAPGKIKWKYFTGTTTLAAPTVGIDAVIVPSNDTFIHAMQRDPVSATGGTWPAAPWRPRPLGAVAQHRVPVVPLAGGSRAFIATQGDGRVHSVDTANGNLVWSTQLPEGKAQGAPAGIFTAFGGAWDYILVGTSSGAGDRLYALDPLTGAVIDAFPQAADGVFGNIGAINGMPSVDYANKRVYFTSWQGTSGGTVWCLDLGPSSDALSLLWKYDGPDNVNGSPVLHNGRVYVGDANNSVWSHDATFGDFDQYSLPLGDGEPKGFLFPDRRNNNLYVATNTTVWAVTDTGPPLAVAWSSPPLVAPSVVLHHPGTDDIYVGVRNDGGGFAAILKLNATDGSIVSTVQLDPAPLTIGPSSLDIGFGMLHMGSEAGILYAVEAGF